MLYPAGEYFARPNTLVGFLGWFVSRHHLDSKKQSETLYPQQQPAVVSVLPARAYISRPLKQPHKAMDGSRPIPPPHFTKTFDPRDSPESLFIAQYTFSEYEKKQKHGESTTAHSKRGQHRHSRFYQMYGLGRHGVPGDDGAAS